MKHSLHLIHKKKFCSKYVLFKKNWAIVSYRAEKRKKSIKKMENADIKLNRHFILFLFNSFWS